MNHYEDLYPPKNNDLGLTTEAYYRKWDNYDDILLNTQSSDQREKQLARWEKLELGRGYNEARLVWGHGGLLWKSRPQW